MKKLIKTDVPDLKIDPNSKAVLNTNKESLKGYKKRRELEKDKEKRINNLEENVSEIKIMLKEILGKIQ